MVKKHQSDVIDRLNSEWCAFDDVNIQFAPPNKSYDWYVANELLRIYDLYVTKQDVLLELGNGHLYSGALRLNSHSDASRSCTIHMRNDISNDDVVTLCELVKRYDGNEYVQPMGIIVGKSMELDPDRAFRGNLEDNIAKPDSEGQYMFFVKDVGKGRNNVNTAWIPYSTWTGMYGVVEGVGTTATP